MMDSRLESLFAAALEDCCDRVLKGESLASCLADYPPEYRVEIARLVPVSEQVATLVQDPSQEFQDRLEQKLLTTLEARRPRKEAQRGWQGWLLPVAPALRAVMVTLVLVAVLLAAGIGVDRASADSLPDNPLYHVKAAKEWIQLAMARGEAKVNTQSNQLATRSRELQLAVQANKPKVVENLAGRTSALVEKMVDKSLELQTQGRPLAPRRALVVIRAAQRQVDQLINQATPAAVPALHKLRDSLDQQERRLTQPSRLTQVNPAQLPTYLISSRDSQPQA